MKKLRGLIAVLIVALIIATTAHALSMSASDQDDKSSMVSTLDITSGSYQTTPDDTHIEARKHMSDDVEKSSANNIRMRPSGPREMH